MVTASSGPIPPIVITPVGGKSGAVPSPVETTVATAAGNSSSGTHVVVSGHTVPKSGSNLASTGCPRPGEAGSKSSDSTSGPI